MTVFKNTSDVIGDHQEAVIVFTRGEVFSTDSLGNGYTGNWVIDSELVEEVDKVIIYLRKDYENVNHFYLGNYAGTRRSGEPGWLIIRFSKLEEVGTTDSNWLDSHVADKIQ